jgi:hypothetical protein
MSRYLGQPNAPHDSRNDTALRDGVLLGSLDLGLLPIIGLLLGVTPGCRPTR